MQSNCCIVQTKRILRFIFCRDRTTKWSKVKRSTTYIIYSVPCSIHFCFRLFFSLKMFQLLFLYSIPSFSACVLSLNATASYLNFVVNPKIHKKEGRWRRRMERNWSKGCEVDNSKRTCVFCHICSVGWLLLLLVF